jgi:hypothetical protein
VLHRVKKEPPRSCRRPCPNPPSRALVSSSEQNARTSLDSLRRREMGVAVHPPPWTTRRLWRPSQRARGTTITRTRCTAATGVRPDGCCRRECCFSSCMVATWWLEGDGTGDPASPVLVRLAPIRHSNFELILLLFCQSIFFS